MTEIKLLTAEEARNIATEIRNKKAEEQLSKIADQIYQKVSKPSPECRLSVYERLMTSTAAILIKNGYKIEEKVNPMEGYITIITW